VVGIGAVDSLRAVERGKQQPVHRHRELTQELRGIAVAGAFDDERMPGIVELGKAVVVTAFFQLVHGLLQFFEFLFQQWVVAGGKRSGGHAFERHARVVDLTDLVDA
jgi:hypothetical protein